MVLNFLNISTPELAIVVLGLLLLFGPQKLPEIVRFFGKLFNDIKRASNEVKREILDASDGVGKDVTDAAADIQKEAEKIKSQVIEAIPRPSMRTFERSSATDPKPESKESVKDDIKDSSGSEPETGNGELDDNDKSESV